MAATSAPTERPSLSDLLLYHLPSEARKVILDEIKSNYNAANFRLACSAFRALVDEHVSSLELFISANDPQSTVLLGKDGAWLRKWPNCRTLAVDIQHSEPDQALLLFASLPPTTGITSLKFEGISWDGYTLSVAALVGILRCVPSLESLTLDNAVATPESYLERSLASTAIASLRCLRRLTLGNSAWTACLPDGLSQLTSLKVHLGDNWREETPEALDRLAALKELELQGEKYVSALSTEDLSDLMGAAVPSLETMRLRPWEPIPNWGLWAEVCCQLSDGILSSVTVEMEDKEAGIPHADLSAYLADALLPCRTLGPRLGRLKLDLKLKVEAAPPNPGPAAELLARCDQVDLTYMDAEEGASREALLEAVRQYGLPRELTCDVLGRCTTWKLRREGPPTPPSQALPPGPTPPPLMQLPALVERAVKRMAAVPKPGEAWGPVFLLLRGSAVRVLLAAPAALHALAQEIAREVAASSSGRGALRALLVHGYRPLPPAGAVILECGNAAAARAAARAARQLTGASGDSGGSAVGSGSGTDAPSGCVLEAVQTYLSVEDALLQVLQSLWDGAEEGGPGPATGSREGEATRLRWLLEAWEGLGELPEQVELDLDD